MAPHCAESTMNPRNDPLLPVFSLRCADGWKAQTDVMKQAFGEHADLTGYVTTDLDFTFALLPPCHVLETAAGDVEGLQQISSQSSIFESWKDCTMIRLSTWAIPGASAAARSADSRCSQVPTAPVKVAVSPETVTVM